MLNKLKIPYAGSFENIDLEYRWLIKSMSNIGISEVYERITLIFRDVFDDDEIIPNEEMTAADVSAWDSLSNIRLVVAVEEEFNIQFSTGEVAGLKNVGEFVRVIQSRTT